MSQLRYDSTTHKIVDGEELFYGILSGANDTVVFIKTGADYDDGNICGYEDKYLKMGHQVRARIGATVICASNPWIDEALHVAADKAIISQVVAEAGVPDYKVYLVGTSDGGYHILRLAQAVPQTTKLLGINPSPKCGSKFENWKAELLALPQVDKIQVYGTKDEEYTYVPLLNASNIPNLQVLTVEGADHEFSDMVDDFIALIDLI